MMVWPQKVSPDDSTINLPRVEHEECLEVVSTTPAMRLEPTETLPWWRDPAQDCYGGIRL